MFKVGKLLPVVLVLFVASAQANEAAPKAETKVEAPKTETKVEAPKTEAPKAETKVEAPKVEDKKADDKDTTKKAGIIAATVGAVTGGATWAKDLFITDKMKENSVCYYSAQAAKVIVALAAVYGSYRLAKLAYDKYYATEEDETSYNYDLNS